MNTGTLRSIVFQVCNVLIIQSVPPEFIGIGSSVFQMCAQTGTQLARKDVSSYSLADNTSTCASYRHRGICPSCFVHRDTGRIAGLAWQSIQFLFHDLLRCRRDDTGSDLHSEEKRNPGRVAEVARCWSCRGFWSIAPMRLAIVCSVGFACRMV